MWIAKSIALSVILTIALNWAISRWGRRGR